MFRPPPLVITDTSITATRSHTLTICVTTGKKTQKCTPKRSLSRQTQCPDDLGPPPEKVNSLIDPCSATTYGKHTMTISFTVTSVWHSGTTMCGGSNACSF